MQRFSSLLAVLLIVVLSAYSPTLWAQETGESLGKAEINRVINDVFTVEDIRREKPRIHPSEEGEVLGQHHALRTAEKARAELLFEDGSLARVGSDAYFSFSSSDRDIQMGKGTALFQVPKNSEETNVRTATATASDSRSIWSGLRSRRSPKRSSEPRDIRKLITERRLLAPLVALRLAETS